MITSVFLEHLLYILDNLLLKIRDLNDIGVRSLATLLVFLVVLVLRRTVISR